MHRNLGNRTKIIRQKTKIPVFSDKDMRLLESNGMPSFSQVVVVRGAHEMKHFSSAVLPSSTFVVGNLKYTFCSSCSTCLLEKEEKISGA